MLETRVGDFSEPKISVFFLEKVRQYLCAILLCCFDSKCKAAISQPLTYRCSAEWKSIFERQSIFLPRCHRAQSRPPPKTHLSCGLKVPPFPQNFVFSVQTLLFEYCLKIHFDCFPMFAAMFFLPDAVTQRQGGAVTASPQSAFFLRLRPPIRPNVGIADFFGGGGGGGRKFS